MTLQDTTPDLGGFRVELRLLGGVELFEDGRSVALGGPAQRAVLAMLWLRRGRTISADSLIEELWSGRPPGQARNSLQSYISNLRRSAPGGCTRKMLPKRAAGYTFVSDGVEVDHEKFESLIARGRAAGRRGSAEEAAKYLDQALSMWSGRPFLGARETPELDAERRRLEAERFEAVLDHIEARLSMGDGGSVVAELEMLTSDHPWHERLWRQLMVALYRAGRHPDAIGCATRARTALSEHKGLDPSPEFVSLEQQILNHSDVLASIPPPVTASASVGSPRSPRRLTPPDLFVGRVAELAALADAWSSAQVEGPRLVVISGEPGIGKTALAAQFVATEHCDGAEVLYGRCSRDLPASYQPIADVFAERPAVERERLLRGWTSVLGRLLPKHTKEGSIASVGGEMTIDDRHLIAEAIKHWLAELGRQGPIVLVIDDVQWAMAPTLAVIKHVTNSAETMPLLVVATTRESGPLEETDGVVVLPLEGLTEADLARLAGSDVRGRQLHVSCGGNPLFATEIIRAGLGSGVPETVRLMVAKRVGQLSSQGVCAANAMAALGDACQFQVLGAVTGLRYAELVDALDELLAARLIRERDEHMTAFEFRHAITRDAIYDALSGPRRISLHRAAALAMSRRPQDVLPAAQHWAEAARGGREGDVRAAVEACRLAGRLATGRADHALAAKYLDRGLDWVDRLPLPDALRFGLEAADAAKRAGLGSMRSRYLEIGRAAAEAGDVEALCQAALGPSRGFFSQIGEADEEHIELLRLALAASGRTQPSVRARLMATLASELTWLHGDRERFELAEAALALARSAGDKATLARVLSQRLITIDAADTAVERRTSAEELVTVAEEIADPAVHFQAAFQAIRAVVPFGDFSTAAALLESAQQMNEQLRQPLFEWLIDVSLAALAFTRGRLQEAESMAEAAHDVGQLAGQKLDASILYNAQLVDIRRAQGRLGELAPILRAVGTSPHTALIGPRLLCDLGETDMAEQVLEEFDPRAVRRDMVQLPTLANYASIVFDLGAAERAGRIYEVLLPFADLFPHGINVGPVVHHYLGLLAGMTGCDPELHLERAIDRHRRAGCPLLLAESLMAWATVGDSNRRAALDEALALAATHDAPGIAALAPTIN